MEFLNDLKTRIPDWAKDIRLNLDGAIGRSSLPPDETLGVALAAAFAARSKALVDVFGAELAPEQAKRRHDERQAGGIGRHQFTGGCAWAVAERRDGQGGISPGKGARKWLIARQPRRRD